MRLIFVNNHFIIIISQFRSCSICFKFACDFSFCFLYTLNHSEWCFLPILLCSKELRNMLISTWTWMRKKLCFFRIFFYNGSLYAPSFRCMYSELIILNRLDFHRWWLRARKTIKYLRMQKQIIYGIQNTKPRVLQHTNYENWFFQLIYSMLTFNYYIRCIRSISMI